MKFFTDPESDDLMTLVQAIRARMRMGYRFSPEDKAKCASREAAMREHVYKGRVKAGRMDAEQATREIALMEEIAADYRKLAGGVS